MFTWLNNLSKMSSAVSACVWLINFEILVMSSLLASFLLNGSSEANQYFHIIIISKLK